MRDLLYAAISKPYVMKLFNSLTMTDDVIELKYTLKHTIDKSNEDKYFVVDIIAIGMVIEWLEPQVKSTLNTLQMFSGKEEKFYSQSAHLGELKGLLRDAKVEQRKLIRDRGYISNSYLSEAEA